MTTQAHAYKAGDLLQVPANETPPLLAFVVQVKVGPTVLQQFEAMGTSSMAVGIQHQGLTDPEIGSYLNVRRLVPDLFTAADLRKQHRALEMQVNRPDLLTLALRGDL